MAWSICITDEGWQAIREACHQKPKHWLFDAINAFNAHHGKPRLSRNVLRLCSVEGLAELAFSCIEETNTCDNGGYKYWIDPQGYYKVPIEE